MTARRFYGDDDEDEPMFRTAKQLGWRTSNDLLSGNLDELDGRRAITAPSSSRLTPLALPAPPLSSPRAPSLSGKLFDNDDDEDFPLHPKTPHEVLGISKHASQDEIKRAYKKRALRYHPDLCRGNSGDKALAKQRFQLIAEAYAILGDGEGPALDVTLADLVCGQQRVAMSTMMYVDSARLADTTTRLLHSSRPSFLPTAVLEALARMARRRATCATSTRSIFSSAFSASSLDLVVSMMIFSLICRRCRHYRHCQAKTTCSMIPSFPCPARTSRSQSICTIRIRRRMLIDMAA